ncbi:MAG: beta-N-acetylhexosaminidase [Rhodospirillaceae bacterium]|nr:beta-N-acetylhexosaminidase [Rhodospirillaceae bacterium]|tara:strand:+ start:14365 stop:15363 length:999 start_codon:yes stop_codon:yes gene_type:complete
MARALITDLGGLALDDDEERSFVRDCDPLGIILFSRNIQKPDQVSKLTQEFRSLVGRDNAPVMIDQEGGRVARLREPHWWPGVPAEKLGVAGDRASYLAGHLLADDMAAMGIDVVCAPCLDLRVAGMHDVIGDRAFGYDPQIVASTARSYCVGLAAGGVQPMIKHMPGHGRVAADPHDVLPSTDVPLDLLRGEDFKPFQALRDIPWGMTAHVVYKAIDADWPATQSAAVIGDVIRGELGFDGVLTSDAIDMNALSGSHEERARLSLGAGCDVVMHCNQPLVTRRAVAEAVPELAGDALRRVSAAAANRSARDNSFDRAAAMFELQDLLDMSA